MGSLSSAKTLGGVGGILVFFPVLSLVGWILILLATKEISESVQDKTIFDDALLAGITAVIGAVVFAFVFALVVFTGSAGGPFASGPFAFSGVFLGVLGAFWVFSIISAIFLKRSYEKTSQRLNVSAFATAGLLYLIGAALTIVLVGFLILLIALIFQVVAYFSIQDRPPTPSWSQPRNKRFLLLQSRSNQRLHRNNNLSSNQNSVPNAAPSFLASRSFAPAAVQNSRRLTNIAD